MEKEEILIPSSKFLTESLLLSVFTFPFSSWIKFKLINGLISINKPMPDCISDISDHFDVALHKEVKAKQP
jgi:hypothetical protein